MSSESVARYARALNGIPTERNQHAPLPKRLLTSRLTWTLLAMTLIFGAALVSQYLTITADIETRDGFVPGINGAAIREAAGYAWPTLAFWVVLFLLADRFRPQRLAMWYLAVFWGGSVATFLSLHINTWAATQLSITGVGDPSTGARAAIYIAPFVEEAAKATILFWVAILVRYRLVTKLNGIALAGLSGAGFAFTENIIYYARAIVYSSQNIDVGDAGAAVQQLVWLRGVVTAFGHPLFTMMTGVGLIIGLRTHSKVVRVLAPVTGYLLAALLHMVFNSQASFAEGPMQMILYFALAIPLVLSAVFYAVRQGIAESRLIRDRLTDYARMGWLNAADPIVASRQRSRFHALAVALTRGWTVFRGTVSLQRTLTELAYLRDAEVKGVIDAAAQERAKELLYKARSLRDIAIDDPRGQKLTLPRLRKPKPTEFAPPSYPGPAGLGGNWPPPPGSAPLGSSTYSAVDPSWGPPTR